MTWILCLLGLGINFELVLLVGDAVQAWRGE